MPFPDKEWLARVTATPWHTKPEHDQPVMQFAVDRGQDNQLNEWLGEHNKTCRYAGLNERGMPKTGAIGGVLTFSFTGTTLGTVTKATCACGGEVDLTEYGEW